MKILSELDRAYISGLFDGEGSIFFYSKFSSFVITQNINGIKVLKWLKKAIGVGSVTLHVRAKGNTKTVYRYKIQSTKYSQLLVSQLLPYLKVKKKVAEKLMTL